MLSCPILWQSVKRLLRGPTCVIVPNFLPIGHCCGDMTIFYFFNMAVIRHVGFSKVVDFNCRYSSKCQYAKFGAHQTTRCRDRFFKMAAVRHIGFVIGTLTLGPTTRTTWWSLSLCKIWLELGIDIVVSTIWTL